MHNPALCPRFEATQIWLYEHREDLWASGRERQRGWARMFADDYADAVAAELAENGVWVEFVDLSYTGALAFWGDRKVTVERAQEVLFAGWGFWEG